MRFSWERHKGVVTVTWLCFRRKNKLEGIVLRFLVCEKGVYILFLGSPHPPSL